MHTPRHISRHIPKPVPRPRPGRPRLFFAPGLTAAGPPVCSARMHDYRVFRHYPDGRPPRFLGTIKAADQEAAQVLAEATFRPEAGTRVVAEFWPEADRQRRELYEKLRRLAGG